MKQVLLGLLAIFLVSLMLYPIWDVWYYSHRRNWWGERVDKYGSVLKKGEQVDLQGNKIGNPSRTETLKSILIGYVVVAFIDANFGTYPALISLWHLVVFFVGIPMFIKGKRSIDDSHDESTYPEEDNHPKDGDIYGDSTVAPKVKERDPKLKDEKRDGTYKTLYENRQLKQRCTYKDGKLHGPFKQYYNTNFTDIHLKKKGTYKDGKPHGPFESFYEKYGQLKWKGTYKDGKRDGPYESFYENGQLRQKCTYKDGKRDGPFEQYYWGGQLDWKCTFKDGKLHGPCEHYYSDGQLAGQGTFDMGNEGADWVRHARIVTKEERDSDDLPF